MNYLALNGKATAVIKSLGFPITVTRDGATVGKGHAVVSPSTKSKQPGATSPSPLSIASKTMYATAAGKFDPQVGDLVTSKIGQWQILDVEDYKPSVTTIAYRFEVQ